MSKYTTELRYIIDDLGKEEVKSWFTNYNLYDYISPYKVNVINKSGLWNKDRLAEEILDRFFLEEIGFSSIGEFKHYAKITMKNIMARYLPIIYSNCLEYDVLSNIKTKETFSHTVDSTADSTGNSEQSSSSINKENDTPQGSVRTGSDTWLTSYSDNSGNSESNDHSESNSTSTETYTKEREGMSGINYSAPELITKYRNSIIGVNEEILDILENKLFMLIY